MTSILDSRSAEDFIKAVYVLQQNSDRVSTNALAEALDVKAPSVTDMARRLEGNGLLDYQKYRGVRLSDSGQEIALKLLRRHRLIELYLMTELGYELHEVHDEAEVLEHNVSDRFIRAIADKLGNPQFDPHGDPIPDAAGVITRRDLTRLSDIALHTPATVARLKAPENDMLQHILDRGLCLNAEVEVLNRDPFEGPVTVVVDGEERVVGHNITESVWVQQQEPEN
ncbi:MAG: metal-dependent transcriptional regulator [Chloroflexota bacterium]